MSKAEFLEDAAGRAPGNEVSISIRSLLAYWDAKRRGYWYVRQINDDLKRHHLATDPSFEEGWIDSHVRLIPHRRSDEAIGEGKPVAAGSDPSENQIAESAQMAGSLTFAELESAIFAKGRPNLVHVSPSDTLVKAQSLMMKNDYSQLPVLSGTRTLVGAVSWESMAKAFAHKSPAQVTLADCIIPADLAALSDDLLINVPKVIKQGFIFTKDENRVVVGVVTTSDLSLAFEELSGPFLRLRVAERLLRSLAESGFTDKQIREAAHGKVQTLRAVDSLTFGELQGLFETKGQWDELSLSVDRGVFLSMLNEVRDYRNQVMHFRDDGVEKKITSVENMINWLRHLLA